MAKTTFTGPVVSKNGFESGPGTETKTENLTVNGSVVNIPNLPTADPNVAGQPWNDGGVLTVSAG